MLTYIGFDGISTLSEEVENPKRNIFLATVLVCVITGFLASAEVYGAQLLSPQYMFPASEVENAFRDVATPSPRSSSAPSIPGPEFPPTTWFSWE